MGLVISCQRGFALLALGCFNQRVKMNPSKHFTISLSKKDGQVDEVEILRWLNSPVRG